MSTLISSLTASARVHLVESTANFWTDAELTSWAILGIKDLWRAIADLKQNHFIVINNFVTLPANSNQLANVPIDVHKVINLEPVDLTVNSPNSGLLFKPQTYQSDIFQQARSQLPIQGQNDTIFYAVHGSGGPVGPPIIQTAPQVTSTISISLTYVPVLPALDATMANPIPGESDQALIDYIVAYARAKEREMRDPDPAWIAKFEEEKSKITQALGVREYQELPTAQAQFEDYW